MDVVRSFRPHGGEPAASVAFAGDLVLSGGEDGALAAIDPRVASSSSPAFRLPLCAPGSGEAVGAVAWSGLRPSLAWAAAGSRLVAVDLRRPSGAVFEGSSASGEEADALALDPEGVWVALGDDEGSVGLWRVEDCVGGRRDGDARGGGGRAEASAPASSQAAPAPSSAPPRAGSPLPPHRVIRSAHGGVVTSLVWPALGLSPSSASRAAPLVSGGTDAVALTWEAERLAPRGRLDALAGRPGAGQALTNPPFVLSLAAEARCGDAREGPLVVAGLGDGSAALFRAGTVPACARLDGGSERGGGGVAPRGPKGSRSAKGGRASRASRGPANRDPAKAPRLFPLARVGGHASGVGAVAFLDDADGEASAGGALFSGADGEAGAGGASFSGADGETSAGGASFSGTESTLAVGEAPSPRTEGVPSSSAASAAAASNTAALDASISRPLLFVTCGNDGRIGVWDARRPEAPRRVLGERGQGKANGAAGARGGFAVAKVSGRVDLYRIRT